MSVDEANRRKLWDSLRTALGADSADTLMTMLPPQPMAQLATRDDMAALAATLRGEIRSESGELRSEMSELRVEMGELRVEMRSEMAELRADLGRQLLTLGVALGSLIVAVLGTILTLGFAGAFA